MIEGLRDAYQLGMRIVQVIRFSCGHVVTFPDDALARAKNEKKPADYKYWQDNSVPDSKKSRNLIGRITVRPCPLCPRKQHRCGRHVDWYMEWPAQKMSR